MHTHMADSPRIEEYPAIRVQTLDIKRLGSLSRPEPFDLLSVIGILLWRHERVNLWPKKSQNLTS